MTLPTGLGRRAARRTPGLALLAASALATALLTVSPACQGEVKIKASIP